VVSLFVSRSQLRAWTDSDSVVLDQGRMVAGFWFGHICEPGAARYHDGQRPCRHSYAHGRTSMLEETQPGLRPHSQSEGALRKISWSTVHALRNAMIPVITVLGLQFGALLAGEDCDRDDFSWPGVGRLTIQAISNRDYYLVKDAFWRLG